MGSICKETEFNSEKAELITEPKNRNKIFLKQKSAKFSNIPEISEGYEEEKSNDKSLTKNFYNFRYNSTRLPKTSAAKKFLSFDLLNTSTNKKVISKLSMEKFNELFGNNDYFIPKIKNKNKTNIKSNFLGNPTVKDNSHSSHLNTFSNDNKNLYFNNINEAQLKNVILS